MGTWFQNKISLFRDGLSTYSRSQRLFLLFAMLCGALICCEYAIVRPVSTSLFIESYTARFLPVVWLAAIPVNFLFVSLYNILLPRWGSRRLFFIFIGLVICSNVAFSLFSSVHRAFPFCFFIWKEVYIMVLFQLLWSLIHANLTFDRAKYLYGFIFGIGGLGSMLGSIVPGFFAVTFGSESLLMLTLPLYLLLMATYLMVWRFSEVKKPQLGEGKREGVLHGLKLIKGSRMLILALLMVIFMQMVSAILEYQFSHFVEKAYIHKDLRTEFVGKIHAIGNTLTAILQFLGTYLIVKSIGFRRSHMVVPATVGIGATSLLFLPAFPVMTLNLIAIKSLDFSVFNVLKEMLYVPLSADEKFRAKAVIDIFAYRCAKALSALLILALQFAFIEHIRILSSVVLVISFLWMVAIAYGLKESRETA